MALHRGRTANGEIDSLRIFFREFLGRCAIEKRPAGFPRGPPPIPFMSDGPAQYWSALTISPAPRVTRLVKTRMLTRLLEELDRAVAEQEVGPAGVEPVGLGRSPPSRSRGRGRSAPPMSSPLVQFSGQGPGDHRAVLARAVDAEVAGRPAPAPGVDAVGQEVAAELACPPCGRRTGRPADSAKAIVFDRPSVTSASRDLTFLGSRPVQAPTVSGVAGGAGQAQAGRPEPAIDADRRRVVGDRRDVRGPRGGRDQLRVAVEGVALLRRRGRGAC